MKLTPDLAKKVAEIPPLYTGAIHELLDTLRVKKLDILVNGPEDQLARNQKAIQTIDEIKKLIDGAYKEVKSN